MSNIPINPALIAGAGAYTAPATASNINLCATPKEGVKCISMQFAFTAKPAWLVTFPPNTPGLSMSQLCSLYVDCSRCQFDVNVYFPDTGYTVRVNKQGSRLFPVVTTATNGTLPQFYVISDSGGILNDDIANVIAFNAFIPEFDANELQNVLIYGYGNNAVPSPVFSQSNYFFHGGDTPVGSVNSNLVEQLIFATQWYLLSAQVNGILSTTDNQTHSYIFAMIDGQDLSAPPIFAKSFILTPNPTVIDLCTITGLNLLSQGIGNLVGVIAGPDAGINNANPQTILQGNVNYNIYGGIIIP